MPPAEPIDPPEVFARKAEMDDPFLPDDISELSAEENSNDFHSMNGSNRLFRTASL